MQLAGSNISSVGLGWGMEEQTVDDKTDNVIADSTLKSTHHVVKTARTDTWLHDQTQLSNCRHRVR